MNFSIGPKTHPAQREMLPDDPLDLHAFEVPGDTDLMFRIVIEEFARMGYDAGAITSLARDPFYAALHGLLALYGEGTFQKRVYEILSRVGVVRVRTFEAPPPAELMQIEASPVH
jgi:hypothetical protein